MKELILLALAPLVLVTLVFAWVWLLARGRKAVHLSLRGVGLSIQLEVASKVRSTTTKEPNDVPQP